MRTVSIGTKSVVGIDGCRGGWLCIELNGGAGPRVELWPEIGGALESFGEASLILIDMPIGLLEGGSRGRSCDGHARRLLGRPRSSSVFTPPLRSSLEHDERRAASEHNAALSGKRIGAQSWNIAGKIREVDGYLRGGAGRRLYPPEPGGARLREAHPEVAFWALNGRQPMSRAKRSASGREERCAVLSRFESSVRGIAARAGARYKRSEVAADDVIDAMALAVTARESGGTLRTLPPEPELDACGLPMEIVYWLPEASRLDAATPA